jgi:hypothetical protein
VCFRKGVGEARGLYEMVSHDLRLRSLRNQSRRRLSDEAGIRAPDGSGCKEADEKSLQAAVYSRGKEWFGLFMDGVAVVFLCNAMREPFTSRRLGVSNDAGAGSLGGRCEMPTSRVQGQSQRSRNSLVASESQRGDDNIVKTKHRSTLHCSQIPDISEQRKTNQTLRSRSKSIHHTPRQTHPRKLHCQRHFWSSSSLTCLLDDTGATLHPEGSCHVVEKAPDIPSHPIPSPPLVQSEFRRSQRVSVASGTRSSPPTWPPQATTTSTPS